MRNKRYPKRFLTLVFALFASVAITYGQDNVSFEISAPNAVEAGTPFRVEFNINAKPDEFTPPDFAGVDIIAGPSTSTSQSVNIVGTKMTRNVSHTYTYVLRASEAGRIKIPSARATVDGKNYSTREKTIEVAEGGSGGAAAQGGGNPQSQPRAQTGQSETIAADDILLRAIVSSSNVYKGEPVRLTFKLYTRVNIGGIDNVKLPALNGFWMQELSGGNYSWQEETYNNKVYSTHIMREYLLFPQQAGVLQVEQFSLDVIAQFVSQSQGQSPFDIFFGSPAVRQQTVSKSSPVINITVKELPSGAPAGFNGAVGNFTMEGGVASTSVSANSATSYDIKISGTGNLPLINAPKIELPSSFEQYTVKTTENYGVSGNNMRGSKEFSIPFIPRAEGEYAIRPVEFSFFNPQTGRYVTLSTSEGQMLIGKDAGGGTASTIVSGVSKEDLKILGNDIRFIRVGTPGLVHTGSVLLWSWKYFAVMLLLIAAFITTLVYMQKRIRLNSDKTLVRNKRAHKVALKRLKSAERNMLAKRESEFYEEMLKALWGYMSDKLNIPVAGLSKESIRGGLTAKNVDESIAEEYIQIISDCEFAQYAPIKDITVGDTYNKAVDLISKLESKI